MQLAINLTMSHRLHRYETHCHNVRHARRRVPGARRPTGGSERRIRPRRLVGAVWQPTEIINGDLAQEVATLNGKRLFATEALPTAYTLSESQTTGTGVAINTYERAGARAYGHYTEENGENRD